MSRDLLRPRDQGVTWLYGQEPIEVSYNPVKFLALCEKRHVFSLSCFKRLCDQRVTRSLGGHSYCGSECFYWLKRKIPDPLTSIYHYCLSLKDMTWKHASYYISNTNPTHRHLNQQLENNMKTMKTTFASPSKNNARKEKKKRMAMAKLFMLDANTKTFYILCHFMWNEYVTRM